MTRTRLPPRGLLAAAGAGVVAGGMRLATAGALLLPGMVLLFAALGDGAGARAVLLLLALPWTALARAADSPGGPGAGACAAGGMGYGDETGMPMRARSGWALDPLAEPFPLLSCGVITATICADTVCHHDAAKQQSVLRICMWHSHTDMPLHGRNTVHLLGGQRAKKNKHCSPQCC